MTRKQSEFGKGCGYCLGLFLAHADSFAARLQCAKDIEAKMKEKFPEYNAEKEAASMWFYAAADHLYEFVVPDMMSMKFIKRAKIFDKFVFDRRLVMHSEDKPTQKDVVWAIEEAKELLRLLDEEHGIKTIKGQWR